MSFVGHKRIRKEHKEFNDNQLHDGIIDDKIKGVTGVNLPCSLGAKGHFLPRSWLASLQLCVCLLAVMLASAVCAEDNGKHDLAVEEFDRLKTNDLSPLWQYAGVFIDTSGQASLAQVMDNNQFSSLKAHAQFGQTKDHLWLRFDPQEWSSSPPPEFLIKVLNPIIDNIELYRITSEGESQLLYHVGDKLQFHTRPLDYRSFILPIEKHQAGDIYVMHVWGKSPLMLPIYVGSKLNTLKGVTMDTAFALFISGIILSMVLYNLFLFIGTKLSVYRWYVVYVGSIYVYTLFINGIGYQYLWPDSPFLQNIIAYFLIGCFQWASFSFARSFLRTSDFAPELDKWLYRLSFVPLVTMFGAFLSIALVVKILTLMTFIIVTFVPVASILVWRRGFLPGAVFLFSWVFVIIGMLVYNLTVLGVLPVNFFTYHSVELGVAFESVLLSFALAFRIRSMERRSQEDKEEARLNLEVAYGKAEDALAMARASNEAKNAFLRNISHHVKTPIHGFYGNIQLLSGGQLDEIQEERLESAKENAMNLFFYMDNLLTYAEILGNDIVPIESKTNVENEITEIVDNWQKNYSEEEVTLKTYVSDSVPSTAFSEWVHVRKVLRVLFDSLIPVSTNKNLGVEVLASMVDIDGSISIKINGLEILDSQILDNWVKEEIHANEWEGLGLEYYVGRKLIEVLGARLTYYTDSMGTSALKFEFPARLAKDEYSSESRSSFPNVNVLVVDDNKVNIQVMSAMLSKLGAASEAAESGEEALEKVQMGDFDIILMDCLMPGLSGQETAKRIRSLHSSNQNAPIIAVSANSSDKDRESCLKSGMNDFMSKPVRVEKLAKFLTRWVPEY